MDKTKVKMTIQELKEKYQNKTIQTEEGVLHVYYIFKAGQNGWERNFDEYRDTSKNLEEAEKYTLHNWGYMGRSSNITAIKKCYFECEKERTDFIL